MCALETLSMNVFDHFWYANNQEKIICLVFKNLEKYNSI